MWCANVFVSTSIRYNPEPSLSPRPFYAFRTCGRRPGCYPEAWSSWHLQVVSLHLKSWTSLSASFAFCSILVSAGRAAKRLEGTATVLGTWYRSARQNSSMRRTRYPYESEYY